MSSFEEAFADVQPPTAADEARVRERYPEVFAGEEAPPPAAEELEENEFRYDDDGGNEAAPNLNRRLLANPITVNAMWDGVVDEEVYSRYVNEIIHFIDWLYKNKEGLLTEPSKSIYHETNVAVKTTKWFRVS